MRLQHVIWDWNGTLLDDAQAGINAVNAMLAARHLPTIDLSTYRETFGFPVRNFYRTVGFHLETEDWDAMAREFHDRFLADTTLRLHADAEQALARFQAAGIRQSILSVSEQTILDAMLSDFGVTRYFDTVVGVDNLYGQSKLDLGRTLLARLKLPAADILMIGDSLHDHEVACALGVHCLLIAQGHQSYSRLTASGAPVLNSLADLSIWLRA